MNIKYEYRVFQIVRCSFLEHVETFFLLFSRVAQKREDAVSKEVTRKLSEADNRKMSRKEKDERLVILKTGNTL